MKVADAMTSRVRTCRPSSSLDEVMRIMWEYDLGALPVVNDEAQPIAMITDRDVAVAAYTQGKPLWQIQASQAMSRQLFTVHVSDKLASAERALRMHQVRRMPVVDESTRLVGVVSLSDLAQLHVRSPLGRAFEHVLADVALTLASISRRRGAPEEDALPDRHEVAAAGNASALREVWHTTDVSARPPPGRVSSQLQGAR